MLPLLAAAASNDGVVVVATERDDDCVTADDSVTRPFTPDVNDAFDELADWFGLSAIRNTHSDSSNKTTLETAQRFNEADHSILILQQPCQSRYVLRFFTFFSKSKNVTFYVFFCFVAYVFSNNGPDPNPNPYPNRPTTRVLNLTGLCRLADGGAAPAPEYWNKGGHGQLWGAQGKRVEREPITGVWGQSPQRGPGAEPLVRGSGGASAPEAESFLALGRATVRANLYLFQYFQQSIIIR